jgi:hypothetical protein
MVGVDLDPNLIARAKEKFSDIANLNFYTLDVAAQVCVFTAHFYGK